MRILARHLLVPALLLGLAACGDDDDGTDRGSTQQGANGVPELPAPEGTVGSVTGMPANPGPGTTPITGAGTGMEIDATDVLAIDSAPQTATPVPAEGDAPVDGVFVLTETAPQSPVPASPVEPPAEGGPPASDGEPPPAPIGTEGATESTTIIVEPAEDDD